MNIKASCEREGRSNGVKYNLKKRPEKKIRIKGIIGFEKICSILLSIFSNLELRII